MPILPHSLAGRLILATVVAMLLATGAAAAVMIALVYPHSTAALLRAELDADIRNVRDGMRVDRAGRMRIELHPEQANFYDGLPGDAAYRVLDAEGNVLAQSRPGPALDALAGTAAGPRIRAVQEGADGIVLQVARATVAHAGRDYEIQVAQSRRLVTMLDSYASKLYLRAGAVTGALALLVFGVAVYVTIRRTVRPIRRASEVAVGIGPRNLAMRLHRGDVPGEIAPLIDAFNAALARLENGYRVQQEFLAAAAHELKTPLALLQAEIELGGAADPRLLLRDTAVMARQVNQLLHLAEVSEGHNYVFAPLQLRPVLADAADYLGRLAERHGVAIELDARADEGTTVEADPSAVFVLAKNLLENAIHHAPPGSAVRVEVRPDGFAVQDLGPGVAPADRPKLFERFWRGGSRDGEGAGLGLAICLEICLAHGWTIALDPGCEPGARFVVATG
ncbi:sensor histidine kinase [Vulcaniibacterium tengchongense]|uniref:histidine kinase n=1 Tax=Vulcaniibacterium tengchongense TaxID=1273429 RepID=A0A3N4VI89_9GAMM|nr:ATP-binding protein [Vulcaniibacterium tengchongense]RPE81215.1 signal transduction histidine kinase [Vulcaniibacterium tengchongense]